MYKDPYQEFGIDHNWSPSGHIVATAGEDYGSGPTLDLTFGPKTVRLDLDSVTKDSIAF